MLFFVNKRVEGICGQKKRRNVSHETMDSSHNVITYLVSAIIFTSVMGTITSPYGKV